MKTLTHLTTFRYAQHTGPIPPETGLFPARLEVEVRSPARILRLGRTTPDGYMYATTEPGPSGSVFLLPLSNWDPWMKPPPVAPPATKGAEPAAKDAKPK